VITSTESNTSKIVLSAVDTGIVTDNILTGNDAVIYIDTATNTNVRIEGNVGETADLNISAA
jgi:hypothetical protein